MCAPISEPLPARLSAVGFATWCIPQSGSRRAASNRWHAILAHALCLKLLVVDLGGFMLVE